MLVFKILGGAILALIITVCLAATIVMRVSQGRRNLKVMATIWATTAAGLATQAVGLLFLFGFIPAAVYFAKFQK